MAARLRLVGIGFTAVLVILVPGAANAGSGSSDPLGETSTTALSAPDDLTDTVSGTTEDVTDAVSDTTGGATDTVSGTAGGATDTVSDTTGGATDTVSGTAGGATDTVSGTAGGATDTVSGTAGGATDTVSGTAEETSATASNAAGGLTDTTAQPPGETGALSNNAGGTSTSTSGMVAAPGVLLGGPGAMAGDRRIAGTALALPAARPTDAAASLTGAVVAAARSASLVTGAGGCGHLHRAGDSVQCPGEGDASDDAVLGIFLGMTGIALLSLLALGAALGGSGTASLAMAHRVSRAPRPRRRARSRGRVASLPARS